MSMNTQYRQVSVMTFNTCLPMPRGIAEGEKHTSVVTGHCFHGLNPTVFKLQNKNSEFCAPLTSFDWNETDPNILGASSIDTTCTIWGLETGQIVGKVSGSVKTQLIAHDKEVHDIAFTRAGGGRDLFASVGSDGSVRMFDLRLATYLKWP